MIIPWGFLMHLEQLVLVLVYNCMYEVTAYIFCEYDAFWVQTPRLHPRRLPAPSQAQPRLLFIS